jgi:hypothetical protein
MMAGVSGGRVASVVGVAGVGGLGVALWWLLAWFLARRFGSPWWVGAVRSSFLRGPRGAASAGRSSSLLHFVSYFLYFFSVVFCVVFIFDVYVLCI